MVIRTNHQGITKDNLMNWRELSSISQFDNILMQSSFDSSAFVLFKHSTRCMVSKMALRSFESDFNDSVPAYFVDLIANRALSNHIEKVTGVIHQSPQVISFRNGEVKYHESHYSICASTSTHSLSI